MSQLFGAIVPSTSTSSTTKQSTLTNFFQSSSPTTTAVSPALSLYSGTDHPDRIGEETKVHGPPVHLDSEMLSSGTKSRVHPRDETDPTATQNQTAAAGSSTAVNEENQDEEEEDEEEIRPRKRIKKHALKETSHHDQVLSTQPRSTAATSSARTISLRSHSQQCDTYSLSIIFSFLRTKEFSSALRVNHTWNLVAGLNTAWPPFNLESFIHQLKEENYSGAGQRRLMLNSNEIDSSRRHPIKKKANDIILRDTPKLLPTALAGFIHLTALNLTLTGRTNTAAFTHAMKDRLRVLIVSARWDHLRVFSTLHELSALRVLVTDFPIESSQLEQLTQLEYLGVNHGYFFKRESMRSVRLLSVDHSLRYFSVEFSCLGRYFLHQPTNQILVEDRVGPLDRMIGAPYLDSLSHLTDEWSRPIDGSETISETVPPARLIHIGLIGFEPSWSQFDSILTIQELQEFKCQITRFGLFQGSFSLEPSAIGLSRLLALRLFIDGEDQMPPDLELARLKYCTSLKSLHLSVKSINKKRSRHVRPMLTLEPQYWTQLEELSIAYPFQLDDESIEALFECKHLRRLDLSNRPSIDMDQVAPILSALPEFQILELTVWPTEKNRFFSPVSPPFIPSESFMTDVSFSTTWSSLHLHLSNDYLLVYPEVLPKEMWSIDSLLDVHEGGFVDLVTAKRFCLQVHSSRGDRVYRVVTNPENGQQRWCEI